MGAEPKPQSRHLRAPTRKVARVFILCGIVLVLFWLVERITTTTQQFEFNFVSIPIRPERYPAPSIIRLPRHHSAKKIPKIQHVFEKEGEREKAIREERLAEVKSAFLHSWEGYKKEAWAKDELRPIHGGFKTPFCGWAATMVDSLDTLWIMGLKKEFELSLVELRNVDFTHTEGCQINLFETTIRHLGGLLSAYDISGGRYTVLVEKAVELAEVLYTAFDTPNRMPTPHFTWSS
jgi:mannosyl-oligosaccharide alpha-1,2-mannosidase